MMSDEQLAARLIRPLPAGQELECGDRVCDLCFTYVPHGYGRCYTCGQAARAFKDASVVAPMALAVKGEDLATWLWRYKNGDTRQRAGSGEALVHLCDLWLDQHEDCVAAAHDVDSFDVVTYVPSSSTERSGVHPLQGLLSEVPAVQGRLEDLLVAVPGTPHELDPDRFSAQIDLDGRNVLLLDDTYTTGHSIRAAAHALRAAGAESVGSVVIGRHFSRSYENSNDYYALAVTRRYDWDVCVLEDEPLR